MKGIIFMKIYYNKNSLSILFLMVLYIAYNSNAYADQWGIQNFNKVMLYDGYECYGKGLIGKKHIILDLTITNKTNEEKRIYFVPSMLRLIDNNNVTYDCIFTSFPDNANSCSVLKPDESTTGFFQFLVVNKQSNFPMNVQKLKLYENEDHLFSLQLIKKSKDSISVENFLEKNAIVFYLSKEGIKFNLNYKNATTYYNCYKRSNASTFCKEVRNRRIGLDACNDFHSQKIGFEGFYLSKELKPPQVTAVLKRIINNKDVLDLNKLSNLFVKKYPFFKIYNCGSNTCEVRFEEIVNYQGLKRKIDILVKFEIIRPPMSRRSDWHTTATLLVIDNIESTLRSKRLRQEEEKKLKETEKKYEGIFNDM